MILIGRVWFLLLICLECSIFKSHDVDSVFAFAQNITTNPDSFCFQGINLPLCQTLPQQIFMEKCINNEEFYNNTLWKCNSVSLHVLQAVLFTSINEKGIYHGGELNIREFHKFQQTVYNGITQLHEYTIEKQFSLQSSDIALSRQFVCVYGDTASNSNEVYEINYRDILIFFCFYLPWTCFFILLI